MSGLETAWQVAGWAGFTFGVPAFTTLILPDGWYRSFSETWRRRGPFALPAFALLLLYVAVSACMAFAAYWVWRDGGALMGWNTYPIELAAFVVTVIMAAFFFPAYYNPCRERCNDLRVYTALTAAMSIAVFVLFLNIFALSGFLMLPLVLFFIYMTAAVILDFEAQCGYRVPRKICRYAIGQPVSTAASSSSASAYGKLQ